MKNNYMVNISACCQVLVTDARNSEHALKLAQEEIHKGHFQIIGATTSGRPLNEQETAQAILRRHGAWSEALELDLMRFFWVTHPTEAERQLETRLAAMRRALEDAVEMLEETKWVQHHCQCDVDSSLPIGSPGCPCTDHMTPLRSALSATKGEA